MESSDEIPQTRYAHADGLRIAYQRFGVGTVRTIIIPGLVSNIDVAWDHEMYRRVFDHLRRHLDCIQFDKRGMGLSDRFDEAPTIAERSNDIAAVMDDVGWESACIVGVSEGGAMARHFAAAHPDRVESIALIGTMCDDTRRARAEVLSGDRWRTDDERSAMWNEILRTWGEDARTPVEYFAPSQVGNDSYLRWTNRFNRLSVSPGSLLSQFRSISMITGSIPDVPGDIPTLILHAEGDRVIPVGHGRALAEQMPHATYVELPGDDHLFMAHAELAGVQRSCRRRVHRRGPASANGAPVRDDPVHRHRQFHCTRP